MLKLNHFQCRNRVYNEKQFSPVLFTTKFQTVHHNSKDYELQTAIEYIRISLRFFAKMQVNILHFGICGIDNV